MEMAGWALLALAVLGIAASAKQPAAQRAQTISAGFSVALLAGGLLWLSGAADRVWERARRPASPADQTAFVATLSKWAKAYTDAENDVARRPLRAARAQELCALGLTSIHDWTGRVAAVHAAGDQAGIDLALTSAVTVGTTNNRVSDALTPEAERTLIPSGSPLYAAVATLRPGTAVRFSGSFLTSRDDCLRETRLSGFAGMTEPRFAIRLTEIEPLRR